jgi:hypothetical protein
MQKTFRKPHTQPAKKTKPHPVAEVGLEASKSYKTTDSTGAGEGNRTLITGIVV